jgi:hypothetical protein
MRSKCPEVVMGEEDGTVSDVVRLRIVKSLIDLCATLQPGHEVSLLFESGIQVEAACAPGWRRTSAEAPWRRFFCTTRLFFTLWKAQRPPM